MDDTTDKTEINETDIANGAANTDEASASSTPSQEGNTPNRNTLYIIIATCIVIIAIIIIAVVVRSNSDSSGSDDTTTPAVTAPEVVAQDGDKSATMDAKLKVRNVNFSKTIKQVKKFEKNRSDTKGAPSTAKSEDGYTYLMYSFSEDDAPTIFGTRVLASDPTSMLTYVFYGEQLIEVRFQYGAVGRSAFDAISSNITSTYGEHTYSRTYNNGSADTWWKTDSRTLEVIFQNSDSSVVAYLRSND